MNHHGCLEGTPEYVSPDENNIAMLDAFSVTSQPEIHKVSSGSDTGYYADDDEEIKVVSFFMDDEESASSNLRYILKPDSSYILNLGTPEAVDYSMSYENSLTKIKASSADSVYFTPDDAVILKGIATDYTIQNVLNSEYQDWYSFTVEGSDVSSVNFEKTKDGYLLQASSLNDVTASAFGDTAEASVNFSTDKTSVLLYEIDEETIGVRTDSDNDGIYETLIAQTPEPEAGDANKDGQVDILDVIVINKAILGKESFSKMQTRASDVNKNGVPDSADSLTIMKYIVGLVSSLA